MPCSSSLCLCCYYYRDTITDLRWTYIANYTSVLPISQIHQPLIFHLTRLLLSITNLSAHHYRDLGDGLHEMTCTFPGFKTAILRSYEGVSYKYAVYSPTTQNPSDHFEYLHSYGDYDRCLKVPQEKQSMLYTGGMSVTVAYQLTIQQ